MRNFVFLTFVQGVQLTVRKALEALRKHFDRSFLSDTEVVYGAWRQRRHRAFMLLGKCMSGRRFSQQLNFIDPLLWSEVWVSLGKTAIFTQITNGDSDGASGGGPAKTRRLSTSTSAPQLSGMQLTQRYTDQEDISLNFSWFFENSGGFTEKLYFPRSYRPDDHLPGSLLRGLLLEARELLGVLGGCGSSREVVETIPPLLSQTGALRRAGYSQFVHGLYKECLASTDMMANASLVARLLKVWSIPWQPAEFYPFHAQHPSVNATTMVVNTPPPPPPPAAMIRMALELITSQQKELAHASIRFIKQYLIHYHQRSMERRLVLLGPHGVVRSEEDLGVEVPENSGRWPGLRDENAHLLFDPLAQPLSSEEEFKKHHHDPSLNRGFV